MRCTGYHLLHDVYCVLYTVSWLCNTALSQMAHAERATVRQGFLRLMRGTANRAFLFIGDSGFDFPMPRVLRDRGIPSPREYCQAHDIPFFVPFNGKSEFGLQYDQGTHRLRQVPADQATVSTDDVDKDDDIDVGSDDYGDDGCVWSHHLLQDNE